jgi:bifunctional non-homologous end joining protein LigD
MAGKLEEYERKRDFSVTREPPPREAVGAGNGYMIHKHHARRLHYDVRLEMEGVLASWAVPKGPSYDPAAKRLAVQTEDHPLDYGGFEGRIPDDEYGGGDSLIWDRGTYETDPPGQAAEQRERGRMVIDFDGEKLKGRWYLVRTRPAGGKQQWLMMKAKDARANAGYDVVAERPESVVSGRKITRGPETKQALRAPHVDPAKLVAAVMPPMLATLVGEPPADDAGWLYELKYDGFRALAGLSAGRVALWSRNALDLAPRFPGVARALREITVAEAVLDGELTGYDARGRPHFELIQQGGEAGIVYHVFDILWLDGEDVRARPLEERRELIESLLGNAPDEVRLAERLPAPAKRALDQAAAGGHEGILCKRRGSIYEARRSKAWLKVKARQSQELAIAGFTLMTGHTGRIGALLLAVMDRGAFRFAGKVGTGYSSAARAELFHLLAPDRIAAPALADAPREKGAIWVKPRHVAQVVFVEWTSDGKLRHPSYQGLRSDKRPEECVREVPAEIADSPVEVKLTSPDKVLYPDDGVTKQMVWDYYVAMSGPMLRALAGRPLALERWPNGIGEKSWYQQNIGKEGRDWMELVETPSSSSKRDLVRHLVVNRVEALEWLAQMNVLTIHMWSSRAGSLHEPDWAIFDFDPADGHGIEQAIEPALALRGLLEELKLPSVVKTSGKRGLHVLIPLAPGHTHEAATTFACQVADAIAARFPEVTTERMKSKRHGRLYLDCLQNGMGKTIVAPYSLRGVAGAPVSAPITWDEVTKKLDPGRFNLKTMAARLEKVGDLFAPAVAGGARLPALK